MTPDVRRAAELFDRLTPFLSAIRALDARLAVTPGDDQLLADRALLFLRSEDAELALDDSEAAAKAAPWAMRPRLFQAIALRALGREADAEKLGVESGLRLNVLSPEFLETISRLDSEISVERQNAELYVARAWQLNEIDAAEARAGRCGDGAAARRKVSRRVSSRRVTRWQSWDAPTTRSRRSDARPSSTRITRRRGIIAANWR